jgi:6-phosphogluconolactonase (cycloisomerase 2 family)
MEIEPRMSKRFGCWLGLSGLILVAFLVACGTKYNSSSDGLVFVGSQGSNAIQSFTFSLTNGHISALSSPPATSGIPSGMILDPAGTFVYVILNQNSIAAFKVSSSGNLSAVGSAVTPNPTSYATTVPVSECGATVQEPVSGTVPVAPLTMRTDSGGKYLYVADSATTASTQVTYTCGGNPATTVTVSVPVPGSISAFSINAGNVTELTGSPFGVPPAINPVNLVDLAVTPTTLPALVNGVQTSACSNPGNNPPTSEFLYTVDSVNNLVWQFQVDMSTGALNPLPSQTMPTSIATASTPSGIAVDPCDRFVYVSDMQSNQISGYSICSGLPSQSSNCPVTPDGSLQPLVNSPFAITVGLGPGPLVVDPFGNVLYVLDTRSNQVTPFTISSGSGALKAGTAAATGSQPIAMTIRGDDNWLFVTNYNSATLSQFSITPASGALSELPAITTDNQPWGVAVK